MRKKESQVGGRAAVAVESETMTAAPGKAPDRSTMVQVARREQLGYLSDMIKELSEMANRLGSPTLAGILELAEREAELEARRA